MVDSHHSGMRHLGPDRSREKTSILAAFLLDAYDLFFGCHHRKLSRVFTINRETYRVCLDCGTRFAYSLETMSVKSRRGGDYEKARIRRYFRFARALGPR